MASDEESAVEGVRLGKAIAVQYARGDEDGVTALLAGVHEFELRFAVSFLASALRSAVLEGVGNDEARMRAAIEGIPTESVEMEARLNAVMGQIGRDE